MQPFRSLIARVRALPPRVLDAALAVLLLVEGLAELVFATAIAGSDFALIAAVMVVMTTALALRRRLPVTTLAVVFCGYLLASQLGGRDFLDHVAGPFLWLLLAAYNLGWRARGAHLWAGVGIGTAVTITFVASDTYADDVPSFVNAVLLSCFAPVLFGHVMRNRSRLNHALRGKAQALAESRAGAAEAAALDERTRIAGELHDVVAHALSAMTIQATAARRMAERDPARAEDAFATVESTGREALTELRRLLGVLRREEEELGLAPQPSLAHIGSLVRRSQTSGLPVELLVEGEPRPLSAGVDLTAYRLVQEALRRAREAEAGRATVFLRYESADVVVEITDDGAPAGRRLLGLRERVAVYGGQLQAGPTAAGGWRVTARLPVSRAEGAPVTAPLETPA